MSVFLIDSFTYTRAGETKVYDISLDNTDGSLTLDFSGDGTPDATVTVTERERLDGEVIGSFLSDDNTQLYKIIATLETDFATLSQTIPNTPNPPQCDIKFINVVATNEQQQGGRDGSVIFEATTSYPGLQYSKDGVNWTSLMYFNYLYPGSYILYAKDDNGCVATNPFIIQEYANPLVSSPIENVSFANKSRWFAAFNPIVFNFKTNKTFNLQRAYIASTIQFSTGIAVIVNKSFSPEDINSIINTVQSVTTSYYEFTKKADRIYKLDAYKTVFEYLSVPFIGEIFGGFIDTVKTKENYKVEIEITDMTGTITGQWSANSLGETRADISSYLKSLVNAKDDFKYNVINWKDYNRAASFTIRYREVWDGDSSDWYSFPNPLYVTYSAKQIGDQYGGNMAKYVPFYQENNATKKAEFLTEFKEPTLWSGLPFDLSFIFSENIIGQNIKMRATSLDINKNQVPGGQINSYLLNDEAGYILNAPASKFIIDTGTLPPIQNDGIMSYLGINRLMIPGQPANGVEYFQVQLYRGSDNSPYYITKPLLLKIEKPCDNDPFVYLKWMNKLGGWDYFRFGYNQSYDLDTKNKTIVKRNILDFKNTDTVNDIVEKSASDSISFGATGLRQDQCLGLKGLATSIKVMMLTNENPIKWQTVILNTGSFKFYSSRGNLFDLKFNLSLPEINIQNQ